MEMLQSRTKSSMLSSTTLGYITPCMLSIKCKSRPWPWHCTVHVLTCPHSPSTVHILSEMKGSSCFLRNFTVLSTEPIHPTTLCVGCNGAIPIFAVEKLNVCLPEWIPFQLLAGNWSDTLTQPHKYTILITNNMIMWLRLKRTTTLETICFFDPKNFMDLRQLIHSSISLSCDICI